MCGILYALLSYRYPVRVIKLCLNSMFLCYPDVAKCFHLRVFWMFFATLSVFFYYNEFCNPFNMPISRVYFYILLYNFYGLSLN